LLSEIRANWEVTGQVSGVLDDGTAWALKLAIYNNQEITVIEEGAFRLNPSAPVVSLWINRELLQLYERRCLINAEYSKKYDMSALRCPFAPAELSGMATLVLTLDIDEIASMIGKERAREGPLKRLVPFDSRQGYVAVLEINFKPASNPSLFKRVFGGE
jgi:hypothetical protein